MLKALGLSILCFSILMPFSIVGQVQQVKNLPDTDEINSKIRAEGMEHSHIMHTMHYLTDVYGPRLTGSPNLKAAGEWAIKEMTSWGFENGHLEPWNFGHVGWTNEYLTAHIISPVKTAVEVRALAWSPSTNGAVRAESYNMILPERPTQDEFTAYLNSVAAKVKGRVVFVGKYVDVKINLNPSPRRQDDNAVKQRYNPDNPNAGQGGFGGNRRGQQQAPDPTKLTARQMGEQVDAFLLANGAAVRVMDTVETLATVDHGQIRAFNNRTYDPNKIVPTVVMRHEDYGRIVRILADGTPVTMEFNIVNHIYPEGTTVYNTIAEIPGTDKKDEVVMLGGHLDSWHSSTGATDNAIGCAVMMEAARILKAIGVKPRRTIRVALWSGEEEGLLGSKAYVAQHFGTAENPKPEFFKFDGYFNIDDGTGRARGASVFGPPEAASIVRAAFAPFEDLGLEGALPTNSRRSGGTDSTSFNEAGLPGIGMNQDPIEYNQYTWHTSLDSYEHIIEDDVKKSAVEIAAAVYQLAMRDEMLPRFSKDQMPAPTPPPGQQQRPGATTARPAADRSRR
ncbi:MAG TPA: M20/M25/M40 family metallo-hydrolase [Blastocatellia bacterium]|nr:M20/M25/M40 family metallo-hydrolase [Blastocatellia bacterium]